MRSHTPGRSENGSETISRSSGLRRANRGCPGAAGGPHRRRPMRTAPRGLLDETDASLHRAERIVLEPRRQRELEHDLGVRRPVHGGEPLRARREHEISAQQVEVGHVALWTNSHRPSRNGWQFVCGTGVRSRRGRAPGTAWTRCGPRARADSGPTRRATRSDTQPAPTSRADAVPIRRFGAHARVELWSTMPCEVLKSSALATTGTAAMRDGSDGTRTRDLRRDRPAL
jgi:hypothetical protein